MGSKLRSGGIFILAVLSVCTIFSFSLRADIILMDGDTVAPNYQCWFTTCPGGNSFTLDTTNFHSGAAGGKWTLLENSSGGINLYDPNWGGLSVTSMTSVEFWARSDSGSLPIILNLFTRFGASGNLSANATPGSWNLFHYSLSQVLSGAAPGFDTSDLIGIEMTYFGTPGKIVYIDDLKLQTYGSSTIRVLDGNLFGASKRTGGEIIQISGSPSMVSDPLTSVTGSTCDRLTGSALGDILSVNNCMWSSNDLTGHSELSFWIRGQSGNDKIRLELGDSGSGHLSTVISNITATWQKRTWNFDSATNGAGFNLKAMRSLNFIWDYGPNTIYIDDMVFPGDKFIVKSASSSPSVVTNSAARLVVFSLQAKSIGGTITTATLDLTPLAKGRVAMTNLSGMTQFRYSAIVPQNIPGGDYPTLAAIRSSLGQTRTVFFSLKAVNVPPTTPVPLSPADGYVGANNTPRFIWNKSWDSGGITNYVIRLGTNEINLPANITNWVYGPGVLPAGVYTWQVSSKDPSWAQSAWSGLRTFTVTAITNPPVVPALLSPVNVTLATDQPTFSWSASGLWSAAGTSWESGTSEGWLSTGAFGTAPLPAASSDMAIDGSLSLKCHVALTQGHPLYNTGFIEYDLPAMVNMTGRITSIWAWIPNGAVYLPYGNGILFMLWDQWDRVASYWENLLVGNSWEQYMAKWPDQANYPVDFDFTRVKKISFGIVCGISTTKFDGYVYADKFSYNQNANVTAYRLQVSLTPAFIVPIIDISGLVDPSYLAAAPLATNTYYWRVRAFENGSWNAWSSPASFTLNTNTFQPDFSGGRLKVLPNYVGPSSVQEARIYFDTASSTASGFEVVVRDVSGRTVRDFGTVDSASLAEGLVWDLKSGAGRIVPPGLYVVTVLEQGKYFVKKFYYRITE